MSKKIEELSTTELLNILYNSFEVEVGIEVECAGCGNTDKARIYYVCDNCSEEK